MAALSGEGHGLFLVRAAFGFVQIVGASMDGHDPAHGAGAYFHHSSFLLQIGVDAQRSQLGVLLCIRRMSFMVAKSTFRTPFGRPGGLSSKPSSPSRSHLSMTPGRRSSCSPSCMKPWPSRSIRPGARPPPRCAALSAVPYLVVGLEQTREFHRNDFLFEYARHGMIS